MNADSHPFQVAVWQPGTPGSRLFDKPSWMEMARCVTEYRAREVAQCLSIRHKYVAVARLDAESHRFVPFAWYPDEAAVKEATEK